MSDAFRGVLFIGDPHLASRVPGFRRDDYGRAVLGKLRWALDYARDQRLVPAILGDVFHYPRDNANWLLGELIGLLAGRGVLTIFGNHDYNDGTLGPDDSFAVIDASGVWRRVDLVPWRGVIAGREVVVGGTSHGEPIVKSFERPSADALVLWMTHHDIRVPGYEEAARVNPKDIPGVDLVINGHIHRSLEDVRAGSTVFKTPGNIARVNRSDASESHVPSVLEVIVRADGVDLRRIPVPHEPFATVFYEVVADSVPAEGVSSFVTGLAELQARATSRGEGLIEFLARNTSELEEPVKSMIDDLAKEVLGG
ncbi:MAG: metallophosphoesterase family protein [Phycisphaerales bacterium]